MSEQSVLPWVLGERGTFESFVTGPNRELVDRLKSPRAGFECLWLYGERETGKTHLLQAVCHARPRSAYIPAGEMDAELRVYGSFDVVTVDDVTAWIGEKAAETALMALYGTLASKGGSLVVTADRSPRDVDFALADLSSRLRAGACFRVMPLTDEDKVRLLADIAAARGLELPEDVAGFLLARTRRDQGSLLRAFDRLDEASLAQGRRITIPFVKKALGL